MHKKNIFLLLGLVPLLSAMNELQKAENTHDPCKKKIQEFQQNLQQGISKANQLTFTQAHAPEFITFAAVGGLVVGCGIGWYLPAIMRDTKILYGIVIKGDRGIIA